MTLSGRMTAGCAAVLAMALASVPANAAAKRTTAPGRPAAPAVSRKAAGVLPPLVFEVNPIKVNPVVQPNIMIVGQHLTPTTTVRIGGLPATTVQVPDAYHLLAKLPDNLSQGSHSVEVTNEAGTAFASDDLVIDSSGNGPSSLTMFVGGGLLLLLVLAIRLARTPGIG